MRMIWFTCPHHVWTEAKSPPLQEVCTHPKETQKNVCQCDEPSPAPQTPVEQERSLREHTASKCPEITKKQASNPEITMLINQKNGDAAWRDSDELQTSKLLKREAFTSLGVGVPVPKGRGKITCHFVHDLKASEKSVWWASTGRAHLTISSIQEWFPSKESTWFVPPATTSGGIELHGTLGN